MAVTMRDVAREAGVSPKTVSNVMNGYPYIRAETRTKVLAAIDALGYRMNISARNLKSGRTGIIGLAVLGRAIRESQARTAQRLIAWDKRRQHHN